MYAFKGSGQVLTLKKIKATYKTKTEKMVKDKGTRAERM